MRPTVSTVAVLLICCFSVACGHISPKETGTPESPGLYVLQNSGVACGKDRLPDNQKFAIENISTALDSLLARSGDTRTIILYVHGRAAGKEEEPDKSLKDVVPCLEHECPARVLMFFWPGAAVGGPLGFPEDQARQAGPGLGQALTGLKKYKADNSAKLLGRKFVLLTHSMGSIVLEEYLRSYKAGDLPSGLFDTVVLSSSASASAGHADWLKKTDFSGHTYVTANDNDSMNKLIEAKTGLARLGERLETLSGDKVALAPNALYVDFSKTGVDHRYCIASGQKGNPYIKDFFRAVLSGNPFKFDGYGGVDKVEERDGTKIYYFKK
jgi:hypothetical protein